MRAFIRVLILVVLGFGYTGSARADLLVSSIDGFQVLHYDETSGAFLGVFATGLPGDRPLGVAVGPDGNLYVGMNNFGPPFESFIRRFNGQTGAFIDTFASGGGLLNPEHLAFGPDGNLYVASFGGLASNSKVIRYSGVTGAYIDDFVPVGSGGLDGAEGLVFGPDGNMYVTSRVSNQVLRYDGSTGAFLGVFATGGNNGPVDLTFGPDGNLYVLISQSGDERVLRFDGSSGAFLDVFVPSFPGGTDGSSLYFGPDGNLYVTTGFVGNSVARFNGVTGQSLGDFVPPGSGGLNYATDLMFSCPTGSGTMQIFPHPSVLWPPDHKLDKVLLLYTVPSKCVASFPVCTLSVTSNEPITGSDWNVIDTHRVGLRAERSQTGNGRIYYINVSCTDARGTTYQGLATVTVPLNRP